MKDPRFTNLLAPDQHHLPPREDIEHARNVARRIAAENLDVESLLDARNHLRISWDTFNDQFVAEARSNAERQMAWADVIETHLLSAIPTVGRSSAAIQDRSVIHTLMDEWRNEHDPFTVWKQSTYLRIPSNDLHYLGHILLRISPARGLHALENLFCPDLAADILAPFHNDPAIIEDLLAVAPLVFDAQDTWVPHRNVSALLITDLITRYAEALTRIHSHAVWQSESGLLHDSNAAATAKAALQEICDREIPHWFDHAFALLLKRPDGTSIAIGYLTYLSRRVLLGEVILRAPGNTWNVFVVALNHLAQTLSQSSDIVAKVRTAWESAERHARKKNEEDAKRPRVLPMHEIRRDGMNGDEGARTVDSKGLPWLVNVGSILTFSTDSTQNIELFWSWFTELLDGSDPGLSTLAYGKSLINIPQQFGNLLSHLPSPDSHWQTTYSILEPQRRRAAFAHRHANETDRDLGSIILLRVGLNAAALLAHHAQTRDNATAARTWFFQIYHAACRLWLTAVLDVHNVKRDLVPLCFAFMPHIFGNDLGEALATTIPPIANEAYMLANACAYLRANGIEPSKLLTLIADAGANIETALREARQWSELSGDEKAFPEHLQSLAHDLGIDFAKPATTSQEEQTRHNRDTFRATIPWAPALLARLETDGCSAIRAIPLNGEGATWVLQATLPHAIRKRFGLAPDIRILAVAGQLRGHDVRRAVEWPDGLRDVDPDLLLCASPLEDVEAQLRRVAGPWGQRVAWPVNDQQFAPLDDILALQLPKLDVFTYRDPVRGRAFIGRHHEMEAMTSRLLRGQAVGAFGLRKVGKSSLLEAVAWGMDPVGTALAMGKHLAELPETEALVVWLDVQSLVERTRERISERLWERLKQRLEVSGLATDAPSHRTAATSLPAETAPSADPLDNLHRLLLSVLEIHKDVSVCFILDEYDLLFEGYGGEPGTPGIEQIFQLLRTLAQTTGRVSLAVIGRDPVFVRMPHINGFTNPLLGWVEPFYVGPMTDADATELLQRLGKRVGLVMELATVERAMRWTGSHPLLLREFGAALYATARAQDASLPLATEAFETQAIELFRQRDMVQTICGEIEALLRTRFPDSWTLLQQLAALPDSDVNAEVKRDPSTGSIAAKVLRDFGLLRGTTDAPWIPLLYREAFGRNVPISQVIPRKQAFG